jgi:hypothetical protein
MPATQETRILDVLKDGRWHCGNEFLGMYMPRYSSVIHTLRHKRGYKIGGEPCTIHPDKGHAPFMFRLDAYPAGVSPKEQLSWL